MTVTITNQKIMVGKEMYTAVVGLLKQAYVSHIFSCSGYYSILFIIFLYNINFKNITSTN